MLLLVWMGCQIPRAVQWCGMQRSPCVPRQRVQGWEMELRGFRGSPRPAQMIDALQGCMHAPDQVCAVHAVCMLQQGSVVVFPTAGSTKTGLWSAKQIFWDTCMSLSSPCPTSVYLTQLKAFTYSC